MSEDQLQDSDAVAQVVQQLRTGIQKRRSELAGEAEIGQGGLPDLERTQVVEEPIAVCSQPILGRLIVFMRKVFSHFCLKWYMRPLLQQQNSFNRAASLRICRLVNDNRRLRDQLAEIAGRLQELERGNSNG